MRAFSFTAIAMVALLVASRADAQQARTAVNRGDRVRIAWEARSDKYEILIGQLQTSPPDTVVILTDDDRTVRIPGRSIINYSVWRRSGTHVVHGAAIGGFLAGIVAVGMALSDVSICCSAPSPKSARRRRDETLIPLGILAGGALLGAVTPTYTWKPAAEPSVSLRLAPGAASLAIAF